MLPLFSLFPQPHRMKKRGPLVRLRKGMGNPQCPLYPNCNIGMPMLPLLLLLLPVLLLV